MAAQRSDQKTTTISSRVCARPNGRGEAPFLGHEASFNRAHSIRAIDRRPWPRLPWRFLPNTSSPPRLVASFDAPIPRPPARCSPRGTVGGRLDCAASYCCTSLIVETGHFPGWPATESRKPCSSSKIKLLDGARLTVRKHYSLADQFRLSLVILPQNCRGAFFCPGRSLRNHELSYGHTCRMRPVRVEWPFPIQSCFQRARTIENWRK